MRRHPFSSSAVCGLWLAAGLVVGTGGGRAQLLFDGALGTLPQEQGWNYRALPGLATLEHTGASVRLDTWAASSEHAGMARQAPAPLNRTNGFALEFTVTLPRETHRNPDRAGFSVIALDHAARGIELGFWTDRVFAQSDAPLFTHAEDAAWDGSARQRLSLVLTATNYTLYTEGAPLLRGPIRDYSAFAGPIDVYETPDFLFLGDDTSSAAAVVEIERVALILPPRLEPQGTTPEGAIVVGWTGPPGSRFTVETAADAGGAWTPRAAIIAPDGRFRFTNTWAGVAGFLRVRHP